MKIDGSKTYAVAVVIGLLGLFYSLNMIGNDTFVSLITILIGAGFATTRHAISKTK